MTIVIKQDKCWQLCLGWPQGTFASKIENKEKVIEVTREVDEGLETIEINLPAL